MLLKKIIISVSLLMLLLVGGVTATTLVSNDVSVYVDNVKVSFPDQKPFIDENNRTLVPIRFIAEEMGADVDWVGEFNLVKIYDSKAGVAIRLTINRNYAVVNGERVEFDTRAILHNSRTMVPLRFISETIGAEVGWDGELYRVDITTKEPEEPSGPQVDCTPYTGAVPFNPKEWKTADGTAEAMRLENPTIKYITVDDLPHELSYLTVMGIEIDSKYVHVKLHNIIGNRSTPYLVLAEGNDLTRCRTWENITKEIDNYTYVNSYLIKELYDTHKDLGNLPTETDITKVTHFVIRSMGGKNEDRFLAIANPLYGGK